MQYKDYKTKVIIICPIHGKFKQSHYNHLCGQGCPHCANILKNKNNRKKYFRKPTILYYVKISKKGFPDVWKIGITSKFDTLEDGSYDIINTKRSRFYEELRNNIKIEILNLEYFESGKDAWYKEQELHNKYNDCKYIHKYNKKYLYNSIRDTELFLEDCYNY